CEKWMADYAIPGVDGLVLHHLYRAMAWLGEELPAEQQGGATPFAPRTVKDQIEEQLFAARRDLFSELSVVFMDTTSLRFVGAGRLSETLVRALGLADKEPFTPLCIERANGEQTQLFAKEVKVEGRRYIVCRNEAEAAKDAADRQAIVAALDQQLKRGDKALIGNSAYRRYLRTTSDRRAFEIDAGKLADEARYA